MRTSRRNANTNADNNVQKSEKAKGKKIYKARLQSVTKNDLRSLLSKKYEKKKMANRQQNKKMSYQWLKTCLDTQEFTCSICLELMIHPINLECGHSFCLRCMENLNKTEMRYRCALCRANDGKEFYEVDKTVEKLIGIIEEYRLQSQQKAEYALKKKIAMKEVPRRGLQGDLSCDEEVRVRYKNFWEKGRVAGIVKHGQKVYYRIQAMGNQYFFPKNSLNITSIDDQKKKVQQQTSLFSQNIFIENDIFPPPSNTYNIQQLLWQVNYYQPPEPAANSFWNFQPELFNNQLPEDVMIQAESESVEYIGRQMGGDSRFVRREPEVIEID